MTAEDLLIAYENDGINLANSLDFSNADSIKEKVSEFIG